MGIFLSSSIRVLGLELRLAGLVAITFTPQSHSAGPHNGTIFGSYK